MRLIDADALEKAGLMIVKLSDKEDKLLAKFEWKDVPTAYDVEAVVAELEEMFGVDPMYYGAEARWAVDKAISIVRGKE